MIPSNNVQLPHIHGHTTAIDQHNRIAYTYGGYLGGVGYGPAYHSNKLYSFNIATGMCTYLHDFKCIYLMHLYMYIYICINSDYRRLEASNSHRHNCPASVKIAYKRI